MIILADSGSTKVSWRLISGSEVKAIETPGINASLMEKEQIMGILLESVAPSCSNVTEIHFFGAGVLPGAPKEKLEACFRQMCPDASIEMESDIVVAAKALFGDKRGIACILGTGSNSCLWDGEKIERNFYGGGFLLGDEGSGNWIGRALLSDFAKDLMPADVREAFVEKYHYDYFSLVKELYGSPQIGKFLSQFALFATELKDHPYIYQTVKRGFRLFLERNAMRYGEGIPVGFVGSVAHVFSAALQEACSECGLQIEKIVRGPIDELVKYYTR